MSRNAREAERLALAWRFRWEQVQGWQRRLDGPSPWPVAPGSQLAADDRRSRPFQVSHSAQASMHAAIDHLHALCALVVDAHALHTFAGAALARASMEASSAAIWVLSPADPRERAIRAARLAVQDKRDERDVTGEDRSIWERRIRELAEPVCARLGIDSKTLEARVTATALMNTSDPYMAARGYSGTMMLWRVGSGFAHGRRWPALAIATHSVVESAEDPDILTVRFAMTEENLQLLVHAAAEMVEASIELYERRGSKPVPPSAKRRQGKRR
jgi:hypothetical protein